MGKKESLNNTTPRLVKEVPKGYKEEVREGKKVYVLKKETPIPKEPVPVKPKPTNYKPSGTPKRFPPPKPKPVEPDYKSEEDVVYLEEPTPKSTILKGDVETWEDLVPRRDANQKYDTRRFASKSGNTTNEAINANFEGNKEVTFDDKGNKIYTGKTLEDFRNQSIQQIETPQMSGVNKPNLIDNNNFSEENIAFTKNLGGGSGVNKSTLGYDLKGATDVYVPKKYDKLGVEIPASNVGLQPIGSQVKPSKEVGKMYDTEKPVLIPGSFAKGGPVKAPKVKGYYDGGDVSNDRANPDNKKRTSNEPVYGASSGVVGQQDQYAATKAKEEEKTKEEKDAKNSATTKQALNTAGSALGAYGTSYYQNAPAANASEATRNAALGTVSSMGAIGGVIGGVSGIADQVAAPIKKESERLDSSGNLVNPGKSKEHAIGGGLLSPSKALAYRSESGNWGDVDATQYNKYIEGRAKAQLEKVKAANTESKQRQAIAARNAGDFNAKIETPYDLNAITFDENQNLILGDGSSFDPNKQTYAKGGLVHNMKMKMMHGKKHEQACADGGEIKGKGTGTSDEIEAEVKEGSFIVPAKNADLAKGIRKLYLKAPVKSANLKQDGGEDVKLSNGEHLFTPKENEYLESIGVDLEALAPDAEHGEDEMAKGGLTASKARMILHDKKVHGKPLTDQQRKFFGAIASGESIKMACGGEVKGYAEGGPVKGTKINGVTYDGKNWIDASGNKYTEEAGKRFDKAYTQSIEKAKSNETSRLGSEINVYKRKLNEANASGNTEEAGRLQSKINQLTGTKKEVEKTPISEIKKPSFKAPSIKKETSKITAPQNVTQDMGEDVVVPGGALSPNEIELAKKTDATSAYNAKALSDSASATGITPDSMSEYSKQQPKGRSLLDRIGNIDPTSLVGVGQMVAGKNMLSGEVRPEDKAILDATYNANVNRAMQDAQFGLTPEQKFQAEQDIANAQRDAMAQGVSYAGGSGTQAFNLNRAAINDAWKNKLGLKTADTELRMQKQQYADQQAAQRASILAANRRQAFNDAMGTFQQKQEAGSELIGAGLQNTIGAYRFKKDQQARDEANKASNAWTSQI